MLARALAGLALAAGTFLPATASAQVTPTHSGLVYATLDGVPLRLDLYLPATGATPRPCVLWIHGGAWIGGSRTGVPGGPQRLLLQGIAVASVDYRLTSQAGQFGSHPVIFPAQIEDVKGAVRWLRAHASEYGLDPARFGSWGSSAGAHLAALLASSGGVAAVEGTVGGNLGESSAVQVFADYFGPTDLLAMTDMVTDPPGSNIDHDAPQSPESRLIGWDDPGQGIGDVKANLNNPNSPYPELIQLLTNANPISHLDENDPPGYIAHGTEDMTVPIGQSVALFEAMQAAGLDARYREVAGAGHGSLGNATDSLAAAFIRGVFFPVVADVAPSPGAAHRLAARPNPARRGVTFTAARGFAAGDALEVFDPSGRRVASRSLSAGATRVEWDGRDDAGRRVRAGVYLARIAGGAWARVAMME